MEQNRQFLIRIRDFYHSVSFFDEEFSRVISPLLDSFTYKKGIPLDLEEPLDYYTSTTATTLLALYHLRVLDNNLREQFHETLFWLKDHTENPIIKMKNPEDIVAWDVSESASVWATSLAIWALLSTNYRGQRLNEIIDAVMWLVNQQKDDGGWGFDKQSESRIYFTGLALHSLQLSLKSLHFEVPQENNIRKARQLGLNYILQRKEETRRFVYWRTAINQKEEPDPASTLYALWALYEEDANKYKGLTEKGVRFLRHELGAKEVWDFKKFIEETYTKYGTQKIIISYSPSFLIFLLRIGVNPFDEMCLRPLRWLRENKGTKGWHLPGHSEHALSFTTAYALWAINQWHRYALRQVIKEMDVQPLTLRELRKRITILVGLIITLIVTLLFLNAKLVPSIRQAFSSFYGDYGIIGVITLIASLITLFGALKYLDSHFLAKRVSGTFRSAVRFVIRLLYLK